MEIHRCDLMTADGKNGEKGVIQIERQGIAEKTGEHQGKQPDCERQAVGHYGPDCADDLGTGLTEAERSRMDPKKQFSKKLARWTSVFWFAYMTWLSIILFMVPEAALFPVYMGLIATIVMTLNVWAYTRNSIYEKGINAMLDKARIEIGLKNSADKNPRRVSDSDPYQEAEEEDAEEGGEG